MDPGIAFTDLLAHNAEENDHWKRWFVENPVALDLACDVAGAMLFANVGLFSNDGYFKREEHVSATNPVASRELEV